jgi:hypothetical protein
VQPFCTDRAAPGGVEEYRMHRLAKHMYAVYATNAAHDVRIVGVS